MFNIYNYDSPMECWKKLTEEGKFFSKKNVILCMNWDDSICTFEGKFRPNKSIKRVEKYLIKTEFERFKKNAKAMSSCTIRFGNFKEKNDFCLVGGTYRDNTFYLFCRSVECSLELPFDLVLMNKIFKESGIKVKKLVIITTRLFRSTRAGRTMYFNKLKGFLDENIKRRTIS